MNFKNPFDYVADLPGKRELRADYRFERRQDFRLPPKPRDPEIRPSHLTARRYFPTHPLLNISRKLPAKLTREDWGRLETQRILAKFDQWKRQNG